MFAVFSGFDVIALVFLSLLLIGWDTRTGFGLLWVVYLMFGWWFGRWSPTEVPTWVSNHFFDICLYFVTYMAIGATWSVFKWWLLVRKSAETYKGYLAEYNSLPVDGNIARNWVDYLNGRSGYTKFPPRVRDYKGKITDWIAFWWFSMIQTLFGDWLHKLIIGVYNLFYNVYDAITKSAFSGIIPETPKKD